MRVGSVAILAVLALLVAAEAYTEALADFRWAGQDPLLETAKWEDPFCSVKNGREREECDEKKALALYEKYLAEHELEDWQRADVLAHMGVVALFGMKEPDGGKARACFEKAVKLAGDKYLSPDISLAKTNYPSLIADSAEQFDALLALADWVLRMDVPALKKVLIRGPGPQPMRIVDADTGEEAVASMQDVSPEAAKPDPDEGIARSIRRRLDLFLQNQLPEACAQSALRQSDPAAALALLIERTEGSPIADFARAKLDEAQKLKEIREDAGE